MRALRDPMRALRVPVGGAPLGDLALGFAFVLAAEVEVLIRIPVPSDQQVIAVVSNIALLSLAWCRRWPLLPLALMAAAGITAAWMRGATDSWVSVTALFVATYSLGATAGNRELVIGSILPLVTISARSALNASSLSPATALPFFAIFVVGAPIIAGRAVRSRALLARELEQQRSALWAEREVRAAEASASERLEVMGELHDVVSTGIEKLVSDVALAESSPGERGPALVRQVETTARTVLGEMRMLLGALAQPSRQGGGSTDSIVTEPREDRDERVRARGSRATEPTLRRSRTGELIDRWPVALAFAVFLGLQLELQRAGLASVERGLYLLGGAAVAAPLAWSRHRPLPAAASSLTAVTLFSNLIAPLGSFISPITLFFVLPFVVAAFSDRRRAVLGLLLCALGLTAAFGLGTFISASVVPVAAWAAGRVLHDRARLVSELRNTNRHLAEEREARAGQAVAAERARIARELHDVIGHTLTVVVLQAAAARRMWDQDHEQAITALNTVSLVSREGLKDLLRSLDSLEAAEDRRLRRDGLVKPDGLIGRARHAGLAVDLSIEGPEVTLDASVERAAYRVLQEALTNVLKHAPGSKARVTLRYSDRELEVEVVNCLMSTARKGESTGQGLSGMRERVEAQRGRLRFGEQPNGEFGLRAEFPLNVVTE